MPRIYTSQSDPLDFCVQHFPTENTAWIKYGDLGDGPDGRGNCFGYDAAHPCYEENGGYTCETCGRELRERDN